jgi:proteasome lid subunit RPN8/RPN11
MESCGALLGRPGPEGWRIVSLQQAANARIDSTRNRFAIDSAALVAIVSQARVDGLEVAGFYHSHPDQTAQPSATDLAEAHWLGCVTVITEIAQGKAAATRAFLLSGASELDKHFDPLAIELGDHAADPGSA